MSITFKNFQDSVTVECFRSLNLLAHAQIEELEIGSRCGGYGECGGDRIEVLQGLAFLSPLTYAEKKHLSDIDIAKGIRLACQCFPEQDEAEICIQTSR